MLHATSYRIIRDISNNVNIWLECDEWRARVADNGKSQLRYAPTEAEIARHLDEKEATETNTLNAFVLLSAATPHFAFHNPVLHT